MGDTITPAEAQAHTAANQAEIDAERQRYNENFQRSIDEQNAQNEGNFFKTLALHKAGQDAENALFFMGEWQKTVDGNIEMSAAAKANGDIAPPSQSMTFGPLFADGDDEGKWDVLGDMWK